LKNKFAPHYSFGASLNERKALPISITESSIYHVYLDVLTALEPLILLTWWLWNCDGVIPSEHEEYPFRACAFESVADALRCAHLENGTPLGMIHCAFIHSMDATTMYAHA
jgi:hypothetical protein